MNFYKAPLSISIPRRKAAIRRGHLSQTIKYVLQDSLIDPTTAVLDFSSGRGQDVALLRACGLPLGGMEPRLFRGLPPKRRPMS
jgi:hypothetical protein